MHIDQDRGDAPRRTPASTTAASAHRSMKMSAAEGAGGVADLRVTLEVELPSRIDYVEQVVELVRGQCVQLGFTGQHVTLNVPVALSEALSNAILRGNAQRPGTSVCVRTFITDSQLVVEVRDQGEGFDLEACSVDPTTDENLERECGRGLFLMRQLMDRVERFDDHERYGNVLRLTLRRP
jgi:serine/threonine-protein kinase RsbW